MRASPMHTHTNTHTHVSHVLHGTLFSILHRNCAPFRARGRRPVLSAYFGRLGLNWLFFFFLIHCVFFFQACVILPLPFFFISLFFFRFLVTRSLFFVLVLPSIRPSQLSLLFFGLAFVPLSSSSSRSRLCFISSHLPSFPFLFFFRPLPSLCLSVRRLS